jgi:hypothetical protein
LTKWSIWYTVKRRSKRSRTSTYAKEAFMKHIGLMAIVVLAAFGVAPVCAVELVAPIDNLFPSTVPIGMVLAAEDTVFCTEDVGLMRGVAENVFFFALIQSDGASKAQCLPMLDPFTGLQL